MLFCSISLTPTVSGVKQQKSGSGEPFFIGFSHTYWIREPRKTSTICRIDNNSIILLFSSNGNGVLPVLLGSHNGNRRLKLMGFARGYQIWTELPKTATFGKRLPCVCSHNSREILECSGQFKQTCYTVV